MIIFDMAPTGSQACGDEICGGCDAVGGDCDDDDFGWGAGDPIRVDKAHKSAFVRPEVSDRELCDFVYHAETHPQVPEES